MRNWHFALLLLVLLSACGPKPESYDYHGATVDLVNPELRGNEDVTVPVFDIQLPDRSYDNIEVDIATPLVRSCTQTLSFVPPDGTVPSFASELTDWDENEIAMEDPDGDGVYTVDIDFTQYSPGNFSYKFHTSSDNWYPDPSNPLTKWTDGVANSKLVVPDCAVPSLRLDSYAVDASAGTLTVTVSVLDGPGSAGLQPESAVVSVNGKATDQSFFKPATGRFEIHLENLTPDSRVLLSVGISNDSGPAQNLLFPVWISTADWTWQDAAIYFTFTDRFANGDPGNDSPAACTDAQSITNWQGGDFAGIQKQLESGYFEDMGINVLWLSPVIDNPDGCMSGSLEGITYTSYHGYFPLNIETTENHFGTMEDLRQLVESAHAHGMRVLIDFVANHVYTECNLFSEHQNDGWFHDFTPCEPDWDKPIECWFMPYLPDLSYTNDEVVELITDNAVFWIEQTGVDGFRVDAVKHMVHNFMQSLRWKIESRIDTRAAPFYMVGETFMSEWGGGTGMAETVIKEYVNPWELNGQFDFPFYWKILKAVGRDEGDFKEFADFLTEALPFWGDEALMVSFIGNHDVPRFLSHAAGDIADMWGNGSKWQAFTTPPEQSVSQIPYQRTALALGLLFTLPEIPMIYYGDEIGLAGAGDPDNRRQMTFSGLLPLQLSLLESVKTVGTIRRDHAPLRRGDFTVIEATSDTLLFARTHAGETMLVAANRTASPHQLNVPQIAGANSLVDLISGTTVDVEGGSGQTTLAPYGMAVFRPDG
jgi:neopullulanase